jgi:hypothetical protein
MDYKKGNKHTHRNTHALPLKVKNSLLNVLNIFYSVYRQNVEVIGKELDNIKDKV